MLWGTEARLPETLYQFERATACHQAFIPGNLTFDFSMYGLVSSLKLCWRQIYLESIPIAK